VLGHIAADALRPHQTQEDDHNPKVVIVSVFLLRRRNNSHCEESLHLEGEVGIQGPGEIGQLLGCLRLGIAIASATQLRPSWPYYFHVVHLHFILLLSFGLTHFA
jgi:hypothetical protein